MPIPLLPLANQNDDISSGVIGVSVVDFCDPQPQPNGIDLDDIDRFDGTCCLQNNVEIAVNPVTNPQAQHPIAVKFIGLLPPDFLTGGAFGSREDEFYSIRAIPQTSPWWDQ